MRVYIVASHGSFAKALVETAEMLVGKQDNIHTICAYLDNNDPKTEIENILNKDDEFIIMTDIFGGSVNNIMMKYTNDNVHVISGVNLPLLLEIILSKELAIFDLMRKINQLKNETIVYCNTRKDLVIEEEDF